MRKDPETAGVGQRGMALVLTLMAISFLVALTVQLFSTVNWQMQAAAAIGDGIRLDAMTRSALNLARAALFADQKENNFDSFHDGWHTLQPERIAGLMGTGRLAIRVEDHSGLLQVNALVPADKNPANRQQRQLLESAQYELWLRFLTSGRFAVEDREQAEALLDALRDWIDDDGNERDKGAESGYYEGLNPPYTTRNGPIAYPEELLLIRGMTPALFYGNGEYLGLSRFITVAAGDGKINLNTAPPQILAALAPNIDEEAVGKLVEFRQEEDNREALATPGWYKQVAGFPGDVDIPQALLTTKSQQFQIKAVAEENGVVRTGTGMIQRDDNGEQRLLFWEVR
ncbi:MAG: type II secretion system minor pseudopilin GspK [Desulfobulbaceae bacterium]